MEQPATQRVRMVPFTDWLETPEGKELYPTKSAGDWDIRHNTLAFVEAGGLIKHRGRWHVVPGVFEESVMRVAHANTLKDIVKPAMAATAPAR